jgi:hypothetical protein
MTAGSAIPDRLLVLKVLLAILPAMVVSELQMPHKRLLFSLSLVLGALMQALVPPRKKGLLRLLVVASIVGLAHYVLTRR